MNRQQYLRTKRIIRQNGRYALKWYSQQQLDVWLPLLKIQDSVDPLAEREKGLAKQA